MCGLVGAFKANSAHWQKIQHYMWQGLYMSALRGMGGTGIGMVFEDFDTEYAKTHTSAINFLNSSEWDWVDRNIFNTRALLGHTRSATLGKVSGYNSHPFRLKDENNEILLIHNGHVRNFRSLTPNNFTHDVDSAHVAHSILKRGAIPTLELLEGAYTLIWYDKKAKTMNIARNEERDLWCIEDKGNTKFYFASEIDMLASILSRNDIPHDRQGFYQFPTMKLHTYDLTKAVLKPSITEYEEKKSWPASCGASFQRSSGGHSTSLDIYVKNAPNVGDAIWCKNADPADSALVLYKDIGDGEGQVASQDAYGYIYGSRAMELGAIVRVNGISYLEWKFKWQFIRDCLPIKLTKVERNVKHKTTETMYTYYEGMLLKEEAEKEFQRYDARIKHLEREEAAKKQRKEYEEALASGRAVPVPASPKEDKTDSERSGGAVGAGVGPVHGTPDQGRELGAVEKEKHVFPQIMVPGPEGREITVQQWKDIACQGCVFCKGKFEIELDRGRVQFFQLPCNHEDRNVNDREYQMICPECIDDPKKMEQIAAA